MAISNARITTASPTAVYTSSGNNAITTIIICNTAAGSLTSESADSAQVNLYLVPSTQPANDTTAIVKGLIIPAGETVFFSDEKAILSNGDAVHVQAQLNGSAALTVTVSTLAV
jgi:hypothetical protein